MFLLYFCHPQASTSECCRATPSLPLRFSHEGSTGDMCSVVLNQQMKHPTFSKAAEVARGFLQPSEPLASVSLWRSRAYRSCV